MYIEAANISRYYDISGLNRLTAKDSGMTRSMDRAAVDDLNVKDTDYSDREGTDDLDRDDLEIDD